MTKSIFSAIAKEVGVSSRTVQRILNDTRTLQHPRVKARAERIRALAAEMDYRPNTAAKAVSTGTFATIGLLLSEHTWSSHLPEDAMRGLLEVLTAQDISVTTTILRDGDIEAGQIVPRMLREWSVDGLLVNYQYTLPPAIEDLIESRPQSRIWLNSRRPHNSVAFAERAAARTLTKHLLELGHRRIAYLDGGWHISQQAKFFHYSREERLEGYRDSMRKAGLAAEIVLPKGGYEDRDCLRALLTQDSRPTAVITYSGEENILSAIAWHLGLRQPQDLMLASFADHPGSPLQATMVGDWRILGAKAAQAILDIIPNPHQDYKNILVPRRLVPAQML